MPKRHSKKLTHLPDIDKKPHERQSWESEKQWEAFCAYRDQGNKRNFLVAAEKVGKSKHTLHAWSSQGAWLLRVTSWDNEVDRAQQTGYLKEVERVGKNMARLAEDMYMLCAHDLQKWFAKLQAAPADEPVLSPSDIQKLVDSGTKLHRQLLRIADGTLEPVECEEDSAEYQVIQLSDDQQIRFK